MFQRETALAALHRARLYPADPGSPLEAFYTWLEAHPEACWPDVMQRLRVDAPGELERLALAVWRGGNAVVRSSLIRHLDLARPDEFVTAEKLVRNAHGADDVYPLHAALESGDPRLLDLVARKRTLSLELRSEVDLRRLVSPRA
jgi:hypothetical protein